MGRELSTGVRRTDFDKQNWVHYTHSELVGKSRARGFNLYTRTFATSVNHTKTSILFIVVEE